MSKKQHTPTPSINEKKKVGPGNIDCRSEKFHKPQHHNNNSLRKPCRVHSDSRNVIGRLFNNTVSTLYTEKLCRWKGLNEMYPPLCCLPTHMDITSVGLQNCRSRDVLTAAYRRFTHLASFNEQRKRANLIMLSLYIGQKITEEDTKPWTDRIKVLLSK